jgi:hypothetical protein
MRLITTSADGERHEKILQSDEEYRESLRELFSIEIQSVA